MNSVPHVRTVVSKALPRGGKTPINLVPPEHRVKIVSNIHSHHAENETGASVNHYPYAVVPCLVYMPQQGYGQKMEGTKTTGEGSYPSAPARSSMRWDSASYKPRYNGQRRQFSTVAEAGSTLGTEKVRPSWAHTPSPSPCNFHVDMNINELYAEIMKSFQVYKNCRLSWFHRMLSKVESKVDFERAKAIWNQYVQNNIPITPETSTLIIKAACKGGVPTDGLEVLAALADHKIYWPSTPGIHHLMINLSLNKDTVSVIKAYQLLKKKGIPLCAKTFHIVIRECIDKELIEEAFMFADEAQEMNIELGRVSYNILMNGCRTHNMPERIIELRKKMDAAGVEINDSTIKFTALAHVMMNNNKEAVEAFNQYKRLNGVTLEDFCQRFASSSGVEEEGQEQAQVKESAGQQEHVAALFKAVKEEGVTLPEEIVKEYNLA